MFVAGLFMSYVVNKYGIHSISTADDGICYSQVYRFLKQQQHNFHILLKEA
ncbi:MAG TPA: hypothetical protein VN704_10815 [Verrucomicrobiae bacterium]|nr:hypothetical protein [Verrucomicrobiae bacterium]